MVSKNPSSGQDKKIMHKPVSNTHSSFQSKCVKWKWNIFHSLKLKYNLHLISIQTLKKELNE